MKTIKANTILLALTTLSVVSISCTHIKHIASSDRGVASYKAFRGCPINNWKETLLKVRLR